MQTAHRQLHFPAIAGKSDLTTTQRKLVDEFAALVRQMDSTLIMPLLELISLTINTKGADRKSEIFQMVQSETNADEARTLAKMVEKMHITTKILEVHLRCLREDVADLHSDCGDVKSSALRSVKRVIDTIKDVQSYR